MTVQKTTTDRSCRTATKSFTLSATGAGDKTVTQGWCQEKWCDTAGQEETPNTLAGQPELHHTVALVQWILKLFKCIYSSQLIIIVTVCKYQGARSWFYWPGNRFIRKIMFFFIRINSCLHPHWLSSWFATAPEGIQTTFMGDTQNPTKQDRIRTKKTSDKKLWARPAFTECSFYCSPTTQHN